MPFFPLLICNLFPPRQKKSFIVQVTYRKVEKENNRKSSLGILYFSQTTHILIVSIPSITSLPHPVSAVKVLHMAKSSKACTKYLRQQGKGFTAITR